ncbi:4024_t:CDS:10 [Dentiscutata heterogama]|uniref:4024_t:CDS:1 n=1 Tax=Dentiscutata heterogama TaxID=1316150 RepID=A0ACA9JVQ9_9GLOM|nr:4024_t:CDS:10 [Dentiscutata heterogama]
MSENIVIESLRGLCLTYPSLRLIEKEKSKADIDEIRQKQVTIISGGGAGHEPAHAAYVGSQMLSAAVSGNVFASPSVTAILAGIRRVQSPHGTLLIVKNYTGDCLNFGLAAERAKSEGIKVDMIIVGDDVSIGRNSAVGRRGLAGTVLVHKAAGAVAAAGGTLEETKSVANLVAENIGTIGVAFDHSKIPGSSHGPTLPKGIIELGMGIHGEPGFQKIPLPPSRDLVHKMIDTIINIDDPERSYLDIHPEKNSIVLLVNNLGGLSTCELFRYSYEAALYLEQRKFHISRLYTGTFMTSFNMPGFSLTILKLPEDQNIIQMLDQHVETAGWINRVHLDCSSLDTKLDEKVSNSSIKKSDDKFPQTILCDPKLFESTLKSVCNAIILAEPDITHYDTVAGDDIIKALEECQIITHDPVEASVQIGNILEKQGGTIGCLFCIFLYALANSLRQATNYQLSEDNQKFINAKCWAEALKNALATLENYTPARIGDRTMMDVLIPFINTFSSNLDSEDSVLKALKSAVDSAKDSVESTKFLKPKFGRSTYISYDDIKDSGIPDPGAYVMYQIVKSIYDNLQLKL